jgi:hypothetical protein
LFLPPSSSEPHATSGATESISAHSSAKLGRARGASNEVKTPPESEEL